AEPQLVTVFRVRRTREEAAASVAIEAGAIELAVLIGACAAHPSIDLQRTKNGPDIAGGERSKPAHPMGIATVDVEALGPEAADVGVGRLDESGGGQPQRAVGRDAVDLRTEERVAACEALADDRLEAQRADQSFDLDVEVVDGHREPRDPARLELDA